MSSQALPAPVGASAEAQERSVWQWFGSFLREELRPYPGRVSIVTRMVISATVTMVLVMTFRIPNAAIAGYYTLLVARESPGATLRGAVVVMTAYLAAGLYCLIGIWLFVDYPLTHFLFVASGLFLSFFLIKTMTSAVASGAFAFTVTIVLPLWDAPLRQGQLLTGTLWAVGGVSVGLIVTVLVEYLSSAFSTRDELQSGLTGRLEAISRWMRAEPADGVEREAARRQIAQRAMVGVSRLREVARATSDPALRVRNSTAVSLVGRLMDIAAAFPARADHVPQSEKERLLALAGQVDELRVRLATETPEAGPVHLHAGELGGRDPLVIDLEHTTHLLALSLTKASAEEMELEPIPRAATRYFLADTFTNPEHLMYALRGCLAAMLCYFIINAVAWRGLGTALATCVITALSSVGSSRQKQVLRLGGAIVGGVFFGIGSQVLILPALDSIGGFVLLFAAVTAIAAWFGTSSPRLSYFGMQIALAFYLIHLQEFYPQMNLTIGRDRVLGILLGLVMMWLVYERLGSDPAIRVMRRLFGTNLELLAQLAEPWGDRRLSAAEVRRLRDRISANFSAVNAQADAVLFETGPERAEHLRLREHLLALQPELRSVFLVLGGVLQYRLEVDPTTLVEPVRLAQEDFDGALGASLRRLAVLLGSEEQSSLPPSTRVQLAAAQRRFQQAIAEWGAQVQARAEGILALNASLVAMIGELEQRAEAFAALPIEASEPDAGTAVAPYSESPG